jgi:arylsulfatase A-like enzyme
MSDPDTLLAGNPFATATSAQPARRLDRAGLMLAGLWFGIVCGFVEGIVQLSAQAWLDSTYVSVHILWAAPCLYGAVFGLAGAVAGYIGLRFMPVRAHIPVFLAFTFLTVMVPFSILLQSLVAVYALVILAFGLSVVLLRWLLERTDAVLMFIRRSVAWLAGAAMLSAWLIPLSLRMLETASVAALPENRADAPNIVVLVVDALRADHLSALGYVRNTTPYLDKLAGEGVFYPQAYATSPWTLPSHVSLMTGNTFKQHEIGWYNHQGLREYPGPVLPEVLRDHGYRTGAFAANMFWVTHDRIGRGFLHFDDFFYSTEDAVLRTMYGRAFEKYVMQKLGYEDIPARRHAADINQAFLEWAGQAPQRPFFALLNYMDVHDPYLPPEPYRSRYSADAKSSGVLNWRVDRSEPELDPAQLAAELAAYDGGIAYVDEQIRKLTGELDKQGLSNTILVITADHGESFGEHGFLLHGHSLYNEQLHVPLLLVWPGHIPAGVRPDYPVSNASIAATLLELCRLDNPLLSSAPSLAQWQTAAGPDSTATADVEQTPWVPERSPAYTGMLSSILKDEWQLILHEHDQPQLYNVRKDPGETDNLAGRLQQVEQALTTLLQGRATLPH